jgi:hypothetical protein
MPTKIEHFVANHWFAARAAFGDFENFLVQ